MPGYGLNRTLIYITLFCLVSFCRNQATSQWLPDGNIVCDTTSPGFQTLIPTPAPDGNGGLFVCWVDPRNGNLDIFIQRVLPSGKIAWKRNGVGVIEWPGDQGNMQIVNDGQGNAILAWEDYRSVQTYIYAQKIDSSGRRLWADSAVKVSNFPGLFVRICGDDNGGVIISWKTVVASNFDVATQHLNADGNRLWGSNGILLTNRPESVWSDEIWVASDGRGGAYFQWVEGFTVYAQRIDAQGSARWASNGIPISDITATLWPNGIICCPGGPASAIFYWVEGQRPIGHAQRIDTTGTFLWGTPGVTFDSAGAGGPRRLSPDGEGGAFVGHGRFVQHVDRNGAKLWSPGGVKYTSQTKTLESTQAPSAGMGLWNFCQSWIPEAERFIFGQWIDGAGQKRWGVDGIRVSSFFSTQQYAKVVSYGDGSCYVTWEDFRSGHWSVFVSRFDTLGHLTSYIVPDTDIESMAKLGQNYPNPFNNQTTIKYFLPHSTWTDLSIYDLLGRRITSHHEPDEGPGEHTLIYSANNLATGMYVLRLITSHSAQTKQMLLIH